MHENFLSLFKWRCVRLWIFWYCFWLNFQWSFMSMLKFFRTEKKTNVSVTWNFVKFSYWNFIKFHCNLMLFPINWNFLTLLLAWIKAESLFFPQNEFLGFSQYETTFLFAFIWGNYSLTRSLLKYKKKCKSQ